MPIEKPLKVCESHVSKLQYVVLEPSLRTFTIYLCIYSIITWKEGVIVPKQSEKLGLGMRLKLKLTLHHAMH